MHATPDTLTVLWTTSDREVALSMVFMYTLNAKLKGWWQHVTLIVWGPSSKLLSVDTELQEYVASMKDAGIRLLACRRCAEMFGVADRLEALGLEVKYMGEPLTELLKRNTTLLTF